MQHAPGFLKLVEEPANPIKETAWTKPASGCARTRGPSSWMCARIPNGRPATRGKLNTWARDPRAGLERLVPDPDAEIIMYCGGGYRSALTCDAAQRMGYRRVFSLIADTRVSSTPAGR